MPHQIHVSPSGRDTNSGSKSRPFATLTRARDALRQLGREERAGSTVWLHDGDYAVARTLELTSKDSGAAGAPVVWRAAPGEEVRLLGGQVVTGFEPVRDAAILDRLAQLAHRRPGPSCPSKRPGARIISGANQPAYSDNSDPGPPTELRRGPHSSEEGEHHRQEQAADQ